MTTNLINPLSIESHLVNRESGLAHICCQKNDNRSETSLSQPYVNHIALSVSRPSSKPSCECYAGASASTMLRTTEIMAKPVAPSGIDTPLTMCHGPFALPTIQYLKPFRAQQFLGATCCSTYPT